MAFAKLPKDQNSFPIQALAIDSSNVASVAIGAASARVALPTNADVIRVSANNPCFIRFGDSTVVAAGTDSFFPTGSEMFKFPPGATHIAVIQSGAVTGTVSISSMV